jgi:hypothetical protein
MIVASIICFLFIQEKKSEAVDNAETAEMEILENRPV